MSLQVEKMEKNMAKLTIEVAAEDLEKAMQNAYQKAKGRISIPGFRKGKAPRKMIEQMYGKGVFLEDAVNALIPEHSCNSCWQYICFVSIRGKSFLPIFRSCIYFVFSIKICYSAACCKRNRRTGTHCNQYQTPRRIAGLF